MSRLVSIARSVTGASTILTAIPATVLVVLSLVNVVSTSTAWAYSSIWVVILAAVMYITRGIFTDELNRQSKSKWRRNLPEDFAVYATIGLVVGVSLSALLLLAADLLS